MSSYLTHTDQLDTRDLIKRTFVDLYTLKRELNKITVKNITSICNISRGTFYFYFTDVPTLYNECEQDIIHYIEEGLTEISISTLRQNYEKHIITYNKYLQKYLLIKDILKTFIIGSEKNSFRYSLSDSVKKNFLTTMGILFDDITPTKLDYMSTFHTSGFTELLKKWILEDCSTPTEEIAAIISHVVYKGTWTLEF